MQIARHPNTRSFLEATRPLLAPYEAEANLMYGLALMQIEVEKPDPEKTLFIDISDDTGKPIFGILRMGRPGIVVFGDPVHWPSAVVDVVPGIQSFYPEMSALHGPREQILAVAQVSEMDYEIDSEQGLYRLDELIPPKPCAGGIRVATMEDFDLMAKWALEFEREAMGSMPTRDSIAEATRSRIEMQRLWVWEDGVPVSMAANSRPTDNGCSIGYVYTPPEHRRRGYAANITAALSRKMLEDKGFKFCTLFTDMSNPTSNKIYQAIGYYKIMDYIHINLKP